MKDEINKFLIELIGECFHEVDPLDRRFCRKCCSEFTYQIDLYTWRDFTLLWIWASKQEWFLKFWRAWLSSNNYIYEIIRPSVFALAIYNHLNKR